MKTRLLAGLTLACLAVALVAAGSASAADHAWLGETTGWAYGYSIARRGAGAHRRDRPHAAHPAERRPCGRHAARGGDDPTRGRRGLPGSSLKILRNVPVTDGVAEIVLQPFPSGTSVAVDVLFYAGTPRRPYVLHDSTVVRLRPDLVVASLVAPAQTLTTRAVDVIAVIEEVNGDLGARDASVSLRWGPSLLATQRISVLAGQSTTVTFVGDHASRSRPRRADGRRRRRRSGRVRHDQQHPHGDGRRVGARARPLVRRRPEPRWLRRAVQPARVRGDHAGAARQPAGPRDEGEGARAAARAHLLQRPARGGRGHDGLVRRDRRARAGGGGDDQHHLPDGRPGESRSPPSTWPSSPPCSTTSCACGASRTFAG